MGAGLKSHPGMFQCLGREQMPVIIQDFGEDSLLKNRVRG